MQEYKKIVISKDQVVPIAEKMRMYLQVPTHQELYETLERIA